MSSPTQDRPLTERDRQREETRRRLFDAALEIFRRDGMDKAKIDDIARLAGVSRGSFYFHFPTKEDVMLEVLGESEAELVTQLQNLPDDTPIERALDTVAEQMGRRWAQDPTLLSDLGVVVMRSFATDADVQAARESHPARHALLPHMQRGIDRGQIANALPAELTTDFFLVNMFGAAMAWVGTQQVPLESMLKVVVHFFLKAVRPD